MGRNRKIRKFFRSVIYGTPSKPPKKEEPPRPESLEPEVIPRNPNTCMKSDKVLGTGAFGVVIEGTYLDEVNRLHDVAIKMCNCLSEKDAYNALKNELEVFNKVMEGHPNIVQCYGGNLGGSWGLSEGRLTEIAMEGSDFFLVEELMDCNLASLMKGRSFREDWTYGDICRLITGIVSGLEFLHNHNIVHYDLKPANVLLDKACTPKLADFGASRIRLRQSLTAYFRGTPGYMAPEVCLGGYVSLRINHRLDIYSLGVIMWECISGLQANVCDLDETTEDRVVRLGNSAFVVDESCPEELRKLIADCLHFSTVNFCPDFTRPDCNEIRSRLEEMLKAPWAAEKPKFLNQEKQGQNGIDRPEFRVRNLGVLRDVEGKALTVAISGRQHSDGFSCIDVGQILNKKGEGRDVFVRYAIDEALHDRLRSELALFQKLPLHQHLVECFGSWCDPSERNEETVPVIVHERLTCDLDTFLVTTRGSSKFIRGSPSYNRMLCGIWKGVASGLGHLHTHFVVFQGLSLKSVFLSVDFDQGVVHSVKLGSLRFAEQIAGEPFLIKTEPNFGFMAPEAVENFKSQGEVDLTLKMDIYSLGILIWYCINEESQDCSDLKEAMSGEGYQDGFVQLVKQCIETNPNDRPTCAEIVERIDTIEAALDWEIMDWEIVGH
ncbi:hypothetical protein BSKO_11525 [Bryopsis sp. KO-2023]|nr:hypothetical protein BSKO_11525 [Bryopsis sp. KO-2023]